MAPISSKSDRKDISRAAQDLLLQPLIGMSPSSAIYRQDRPDLCHPLEPELQELMNSCSESKTNKKIENEARRKA